MQPPIGFKQSKYRMRAALKFERARLYGLRQALHLMQAYCAVVADADLQS